MKQVYISQGPRYTHLDLPRCPSLHKSFQHLITDCKGSDILGLRYSNLEAIGMQPKHSVLLPVHAATGSGIFGEAFTVVP